MNPFRIYQLSEAIRHLDEVIGEECEALGAPTEESLAALVEAEGDAEGAAVVCGKLADEHERSSDVLVDQIRILQRRKKAHDRQSKLHRDQAKALIERLGLSGIRTPEITLSVQQNSRSVYRATIQFVGIPKRFLKEKVDYSLDRDAIDAALEAGEELPYGIEVSRGTNLRITT